MLAIRLARVGRKKQPIYRIVVSEKSKDMYGNHLEILGTYNPRSKATELKNERIEHWLKNGAKPSNTVQNLLINQGLIKSDKKSKAVRITKKRTIKLEAKKGVKEDKSEAPAEEKKEENVEAPAKAEAKEEVKAEEVKPEGVPEKTEDKK